MKDKNSLSYIIIREWLYVNYFTWAGIAMSLILWFSMEPYQRDLNVGMLTVFFSLTTLPYLIFSYLRSIRKAWRVTHSIEEAPKINHEDIDTLAESALNALKKQEGD